MEFKPISQGWRNMLNVHPIAIIELQQKFPSQNVFFFKRKVELYSMEWQDAVDLSRFIVSAAPFGGPIGFLTHRVYRKDFIYLHLSYGK